jgi:hypothetical protein
LGKFLLHTSKAQAEEEEEEEAGSAAVPSVGGAGGPLQNTEGRGEGSILSRRAIPSSAPKRRTCRSIFATLQGPTPQLSPHSRQVIGLFAVSDRDAKRDSFKPDFRSLAGCFEAKIPLWWIGEGRGAGYSLTRGAIPFERVSGGDSTVCFPVKGGLPLFSLVGFFQRTPLRQFLSRGGLGTLQRSA